MNQIEFIFFPLCIFIFLVGQSCHSKKDIDIVSRNCTKINTCYLRFYMFNFINLFRATCQFYLINYLPMSKKSPPISLSLSTKKKKKKISFQDSFLVHNDYVFICNLLRHLQTLETHLPSIDKDGNNAYGVILILYLVYLKRGRLNI
jgi:hypothetical protein